MTIEEYGSAYKDNVLSTIRYLKHKGTNQDVAEELAQDAWAKGWEKINQLQDPACVAIWVLSIAIKNNISHWRKEHREISIGELSEFLVHPNENPHIHIDVQRILNACTAKERDLLCGHYIHGISHLDKAEELGISETAVKLRVLRAKENVCKKMKLRHAKRTR